MIDRKDKEAGENQDFATVCERYKKISVNDGKFFAPPKQKEILEKTYSLKEITGTVQAGFPCACTLIK